MCRQIKRFQILFYFLVHLYQNNNTSNKNKTKKYWRRKGVIIVPEYFRLFRTCFYMKNDIQTLGANPFLRRYNDGSQRRLRTSTVNRTNHIEEMTVLLFYIKQHMCRKYGVDRQNTIISSRNATLAFCSRTSLRGFLAFLSRR